MQNVDGMNCLLIKGIGAAGENPIISLEQAQDSAGTGAKALTLRKVATKIGTPTLVAASDVFAEVASIDRDNPAANYTVPSSGDKEAVVLAYVLQQDLDVNNGFTHIRLNCSDVGATSQLGTLIYIAGNRAYKGGPNISMLT